MADIDLTLATDLSKSVLEFRALTESVSKLDTATKQSQANTRAEFAKSSVEVEKMQAALKNTALATAAISSAADGVNVFSVAADDAAISLDKATQSTSDLNRENEKLVDAYLKQAITAQTAGDAIKVLIESQIQELGKLTAARLVANNPDDINKLNSAIVSQIATVEDLKSSYEKLNLPSQPEEQFVRLQKQARAAEVELQRMIILYGALDSRTLAAADKAGQLNNQVKNIKSLIDSFNPDTKFVALTQSLQSAFGGFQALTGIMQVFGTENEAVNRILQRFQGFINVSAGLTQLGGLKDAYSNLKAVIQSTFLAQKVLQQGAEETTSAVGDLTKEVGSEAATFNSVKTAITNVTELTGKLGKSKSIASAATVNNTVATTTNTEAQIVYSVASEGATDATVLQTGATRAATLSIGQMTAALLASPLFLFAAVILAVVGAIVIYKETTETAAEKQERFNSLQRESMDILNRLSVQLDQTSQKRIQNTEAELQLANASGASLRTRLELEKELADQKARAALQQTGFFAEEVANLGLNQAKVELLRDKYRELAKSKEVDKDELAAKKEEIDLLDQQIKKTQEVVDAAKKATVDRAAVQAKAAADLKNQALNDAKQLADAEVLLATKGSGAELKAKLDAIEKERAARLNAINDDKDRVGEELKIEVEQDRKKREAIAQTRVLQLNDIKAGAEAQLAIVEKETEQERALKQQALELDREIALSALDLTENEKRRIINSSFAQIQELNRQYAQKQIEFATNIEKQDAQRRLAVAQINSREEYQAKIDLISIEEDADVAAVQSSLKSAKEKEAAITAIRAKGLADRETLRKDSIQKELDFELKYQTGIINAENDSLQRQIDAQETGSQTKHRLKLEQLNNDLELIKKEQFANIDAYNNDLISREDYLLKKQELDAKAAKKTAEIQAAGAKQIVDIYDALGLDLNESTKKYLNGIADSVSSIFQSIFEARKQDLDNQKQVNDDLISSLNDRIKDTQSALEKEEQDQQKGYANNVDGKRKELADLQKQKQKALDDDKKIKAEQEKLARNQMVIDGLQAASQLALAEAQIFAKEARLGVAGVVVAIAGVAAMVAAFLAFKSKAAQAATAPTTSLGDGGQIEFTRGRKNSGLLVGPSHDSPSKGIPIGKTGIFVEGKEYVMNKHVTGQYYNLIDGLNKQDYSKFGYKDVMHLMDAPALRSSRDIINIMNMSKKTGEVSNRVMKQMLIKNNIRLTDDHARQITENKTIVNSFETNQIMLDNADLRKEIVGLRDDQARYRNEDRNELQIFHGPDGTRYERRGNRLDVIKPVDGY